MRVVVACDWFLKYAAAQAAALQEAGADVALLCRTHAHEFGGSHAERTQALLAAREAGVELLELPGRVSSPGALPGVAATARRLRRWRPQLVHAHDNHDPRLYALSLPYPAVLTVHDPTPHPGARSLGAARDRIRAAWLRRAERLVVHGEELRAELAARVPAERIAVVRHGTAPRPVPEPCPPDPSILLFGRLERYKGLGILLEAMEQVWERRPDVRLVVAGKGPEAALLPDDPRIDARVGYLPETALDEEFRRCSLVVLPYVQASQSGVGLLALARGIPALVTRVGSLPDLAVDSTFVVPPRDSASLAEAIVRHIDHDERLRQAVLARARTEFAWDVVARESLTLYEAVLARKAR
jgi:glycosyltransferase involved in cell wall biosynthesis